MSDDRYREALHAWAKWWALKRLGGWRRSEFSPDAVIDNVIVHFDQGDWRYYSCQEDPKLTVLIEWHAPGSEEKDTIEVTDSDESMFEQNSIGYSMAKLLIELLAIEDAAFVSGSGEM